MIFKPLIIQLVWMACISLGSAAVFSTGSANRSASSQAYSRPSAPIYNGPMAGGTIYQQNYREPQFSQIPTRLCEGPIPPFQGSISCRITSMRYACKGSCYAGYTFADGKEMHELECLQTTGLWRPNRRVPDCIAQQRNQHTATSREGTSNLISGRIPVEQGGRKNLCIHPKTPMNGGRHCSTSNGHWSCTLICNQGFEFPDGSRQVIVRCNDRDGQWSPRTDFNACRRELQSIRSQFSSEKDGRNNLCVTPTTPTNGGRQCVMSNGQRSCAGTCNPGYEFPDGTSRIIIKCNDKDGQWSPKRELGDCRLKRRQNQCETPKSPMNGLKQCSRSSGQWSCRGTCLPGFKFPDGSNLATVSCTESNGQWSPQKDFQDCIHSSCMRPKHVTHGHIKCERGVGDKICIGTCDPGYVFNNGFSELTIRCARQDGEWTPTADFPPCEPICSPECKNGGKCVRPNTCLCPRDYQGTRCESRHTSGQDSGTSGISQKYKENSSSGGRYISQHAASSAMDSYRGRQEQRLNKIREP